MTVIVLWLFLAMSCVGLQCVTVLFPDLLFLLTFRKSFAFCQMPNFTKDQRGNLFSFKSNIPEGSKYTAQNI